MPLPLFPDVEARTLLHHILEHGDLVGRDPVGRTIIQLAVDDWTLETLMTFDADAAELEDEGDGELDEDAEEDGSVEPLDMVRAKIMTRAIRSQMVIINRRHRIGQNDERHFQNEPSPDPGCRSGWIRQPD